jgi:hypothetical protein
VIKPAIERIADVIYFSSAKAGLIGAIAPVWEIPTLADIDDRRRRGMTRPSGSVRNVGGGGSGSVCCPGSAAASDRVTGDDSGGGVP